MSSFVINPYAFGSAAFDPLTLPNLHAWLDASDTTTTWQDTSATTAATADTDPVRLIQDKSGNGNDYSAPSDAARPALRTGGNGQNSLPIMSFDGSDDILIDTADLNDFADIGYAYIFAAVKDTNHTSGDIFHNVVFVCRDAGQSARIQLRTRNTSTNVFYGSLRKSAESLAAITDTSDGNFNILGYITEQADGDHYLRKNGAQIASGSFTAGNFANVTSLYRSIGGVATTSETATLTDAGGFRFAGQIGEVIIGTGQLTTTERDAVETYLKNKWGV